MLKACAEELGRMTGLSIAESDLDENAISPHFRFLLKVTDAEGEWVDSGRDLLELQQRHGDRAQRRFMDQQGQDFNRDGETGWVFGILDLEVKTADGATAWPALVDQQTGVGTRLFDTWDEAALSHFDGVMRLLRLAIPDKLDYLRKHHGLSREALLAWSPVASAGELVEDLLQRSLLACAGEVSGVRDAESFERLCHRVRNELGQVWRERCDLLNGLLPLYGTVASKIGGNLEKKRPDVFGDLSTQLQDLVYPGFMAEIEPGRLKHYSRYLRAIEERLLQLDVDPVRDRQRMDKVSPWWQLYLDALDRGCPYDEALDSFRWLVEEYRVSLFAQKLGTAQKVSEKRLADAWNRTGY